MEKIVVANLKMNLLKNEIEKYESIISNKNLYDIKLFIAPSAIFLSNFNSDNYILTSQDVSRYSNGSYTGQISADQLKSIGVKAVIIGHSELNDNINSIKLKIEQSIENNLKVILCIDDSNDLLEKLDDLISKYDSESIIIAYESVNNIGSGEIQNIEKIENVYKKIKSKFNNKVIYGGSIDIDNIEKICNITDGVIIGKKSIDVRYFSKLIDKII